jgi:NAD(P)-dependent dehydrogenase (short-subunit alcohol dehydrogenase family)
MACASQYLALELGEHGIRVNQAIMGWLDGPGVRFYIKLTSDARGVSEQEIHDEIAARNPLGRIPTDEACAGAVLFLLSSLASEVTGAVLDVNGGEFLPHG